MWQRQTNCLLFLFGGVGGGVKYKCCRFGVLFVQFRKVPLKADSRGMPCPASCHGPCRISAAGERPIYYCEQRGIVRFSDLACNHFWLSPWLLYLKLLT